MTSSSSKSIRQILETFRRNNESENASNFDWSKSQIPTIDEKLTMSEEEMEKIRQKRKAKDLKTEKLKQKKQERQILEKENEEKQ
uniref:Uncharacterized protein n=1 Tax=Romanomermis culicivorax TaxID=13658 RepID=A0A915L551_ROMCU